MSIHSYSDDFQNEQPFSVPSSAKQEPSGAAITSLVLGIAACGLNLLILTSPLGIIIGFIGIILGIVGRKFSLGRAGLALSLLSFVIVLIWLVSAIVPFVLDPTLRWEFMMEP